MRPGWIEKAFNYQPPSELWLSSGVSLRFGGKFAVIQSEKSG
jgi:hypothetical protein